MLSIEKLTDDSLNGPEEDPLEILHVKGGASGAPLPPGEKDNLVTFPPGDPPSAVPEVFKCEMEIFGDDFLEVCVTFTDPLRHNLKEATLCRITEEAFKLAAQGKRCHPLWMLIPEYSKVGNYHYHGMLKGANGAMLAKLKRILRHTCGFCRVTMVKYPDSYKEYIFKDYNKNIDPYFAQLIIYKMN